MAIDTTKPLVLMGGAPSLERTMKETGYDPEGVVLAAGGIPEYTDEQLRPIQTNLDNLTVDMNNLKYVILKLEADGWSGSAPYTQTASIPGMTADWIPDVPSYVPIYNSDGTVNVYESMLTLEQVAYIKFLDSGNGTLTAICPEDKPTRGMWLRVPGQIER